MLYKMPIFKHLLQRNIILSIALILV